MAWLRLLLLLVFFLDVVALSAHKADELHGIVCHWRSSAGRLRELGLARRRAHHVVSSRFGLLEYRLDLLSLLLGLDASDLLFQARLLSAAKDYVDSSLLPSTSAPTRLDFFFVDIGLLSPHLTLRSSSLLQCSTPLVLPCLHRLIDPLLAYERHRVRLTLLLEVRRLLLCAHLHVFASPLIRFLRELRVDFASCDPVEVESVHIRGDGHVILDEDGSRRATKGTRRVATGLPRGEGLLRCEGNLTLVLRIDVFFFEAPIEVGLLASQGESAHRNVRKLTFLLTLRRQHLRLLHARRDPTDRSARPRLPTQRSPNATLTYATIRIPVVLH